MCEYKRIAITGYWICALKPFAVVKDKAESADDNNILSEVCHSANEKFALYLILAVLRAIFEERRPDEKFDYPTEREQREIIYTFKYCDLNRESFIFFVETWAKFYRIGLDTLTYEKDPNHTDSVL